MGTGWPLPQPEAPIAKANAPSTATGMDGKCLVIFPTRDREASGVASGDRVMVTLELDDGSKANVDGVTVV